MELDGLQMLEAGIATLVAILLFSALLSAKLAGCCVACCAQNMNKEIDMIAHSCGARHAGELERRHVRLVQPAGGSVAPDVLWPLPAQIATTSA